MNKDISIRAMKRICTNAIVTLVLMTASIAGYGQQSVCKWYFEGNLNGSGVPAINGTGVDTGIGIYVPTYSTDSKERATSLQFNGNQYVDLGNPSNLPSGNSGRSIAAWAKSLNVTGVRTIMAYGSAVLNQSIFIGQNGTALVAGAYGNSVSIPNFWQTDVWHHVALTFDGSTARLYGDGVLLTTFAMASWNVVLSAAYIGRNVNSGENWSGLIDDAGIYVGELAAKDVARVIGYATVTVAGWAFDGGYYAYYYGTASTPYNNPTFTDNSRVGNAALHLNGTNQYVDANPATFPTGTKPRSVSVWAKTTTTTGKRIVFAYGTAATGQSMFVGQNGTSLIAGAYNSNITVPNFWAAGVWHHICLTYDGYTARLYTDGVLATSSAMTWSLVLGSTPHAYVGRDVDNANYWSGDIDDLYVYASTLFLPQIQSIGTSPIAPSTITPSAQTPSTITLSWANTNTVPCTYYVEKSLTPTAGFATVGSVASGGTTSTYTVKKLDDGTLYYFRVRAKYGDITSDLSPTASATTVAIAPSALTAISGSSSSVTIDWADPSNKVTGFQVERSLTSGSGYSILATVPATQFEYRDATATAGTTYYYRVAALYSAGTTPYSNVASVATMTAAQQTTMQNALDNLSFQYQYDGRGRMSAKKVPGAGWTYMVYDGRDRLVLTQDANQRSGTNKYWTFTKYDALNRPVLTGIYTPDSVLSQSKMQARVNRFYTTGTYYETFTGSGAIHGYNNASFPTTTTAAIADPQDYLTVTYYDNYSFTSTWPGSYSYVNDGLGTTLNTSVVGQVTGQKTKVLDGGSMRGGYTWLRSVNYYDDKYRVVQTQVDNYKGGTDRRSNLYDFTGKVIKSKGTQTVTTWNNVTAVKEFGNKMSKSITGNAWSTAGFSSQQTLPASTDGWMEFTIVENAALKTIGLSQSDPNTNFNSTDFAFYLNETGSLFICEKCTTAPTTAVSTYAVGDVLRIERTGTTINYYKNSALVKTTTGATTNALMVDAAFNTASGSFANVRTNFATGAHTITRRLIYDHASRLKEVWHQIDTQPEVRLTYNVYNELGQLVDKKLHSTLANATDAKQSVDYRYNIRGWMTSMNNSQLNDDHATANTNDDTGDYFGMNLLYEKDDNNNLASTGLFNGNISGMKWSTGAVKEMGYNFTYDAMNRLVHANSRVNKTTWQTGNYSENNLTYDLNGNILTLQRTGIDSLSMMTTMDNLKYGYGTLSNQLQYVQDNATANKTLGFNDGNPGTATDYTYDANGNLTRDLNKGIGTSITDPANLITYNYLNLPEIVTKAGNQVQYIYDATGRKLAQVVNNVNTVKQTDYIGEFNYENDALQFITQEEGRVVMSATNTIYTNTFTTNTTFGTADVTLVNTSLSTYSNNGERYMRVKAASAPVAKDGVNIIGVPATVAAGNRYRIRLKGYYVTTQAYLQVTAGGTTPLNNPGTALPKGATAESWIEQIVTIPTGVTSMTVGVKWNTAPIANELLYINEIEVSQLTSSTNEYQYNLKDHLGNIRLTFTTAPQTPVANTATLETANANAERGQFLRYDNARLVNHYLFDHTNGSSPSTTAGNAQRLSGQTNEVYGLAKSLAVMPGDVIDMEVYAKYIDPSSGNRTQTLNDLLPLIAAGSASGGVVDGSGYPTSTSSFPFPGGQSGSGSSTGAGPKAYLNWLVFDKNRVLIPGKSGFMRMSTAAKETGQDVAHEKLYGSVTISDAGYMYIYISNEEGTNPYECYFDDFKVTQTKSPIIAMNDYYPFGLTYNSYQRENTVSNRWKFQGQEHNDDLGLNWDSFKWRNSMPDIGRFFGVDKLAEKYLYNSPYAFSENKVVSHRELEGLEAEKSIWNQQKPPSDHPGAFVPSKGTLETFGKATENLKKVFEGKLEASGKIYGASGKFQVGPVKGSLDASVAKVSGKINQKGAEVKAGALNGSLSLKFASAEAKGSFSVAEGKVSLDKEGIHPEGEMSKLKGDITLGENGFEMTADNSTKIAIGGSISVVKAEGSVNIGAAVKGVTGLATAAVSYAVDLWKNGVGF